MRLSIISALSLVLTALLLAACGGDDKAAPGSPENPLVAQQGGESVAGRSNEAAGGGGAKEAEPGFEALVDNQTKDRPRGRFSPCNLVSKAEAGAIFGAASKDPLEAPQGPTCIYRTESGKGFVTVALQSTSFAKLEGNLGQPKTVEISGSTAYCGQYGQPMLYVPLSRGRVLSIAGPCPVASRFAAKAMPRLKG